MKKYVIYFCLLALAVTACHKTKTDVDSNSVTPTPDEPMVKKYLVKEYYYGYPNKPIKVIEWNEDYSKINHISTYQNTYYQLDFDFEYYGNDSMQVTLSAPDTAWSMALFSNYICHFNEFGRIATIDYYCNDEKTRTDSYGYDSSKKLVSVWHDYYTEGVEGNGYRMVWDGDNVIKECSWSGEVINSYYGFTDLYHPYYTIPYMLESGDCYHGLELTRPLWKNMYTQNSQQGYYEGDEDGYVIKGCHITLEGDTIPERCYEYLK